MVKTVNNAGTDNIIVKKPSLVVELVGPAGAGKTILSQALSRGSDSILVSDPPFVRSVVHSPFFVRHGLLLVPTFLRLYKNKNNDRCLSRQEIAWMAILNGWHHLLRRGVGNDGKVVVLDQGPVFLLAELHMFGPESLRSRSANKWWEGMYRQWAATLDMVVWLDTSDTHLLERIRARDKWHVMKEKAEPEISQFLAHYRVAYEQVISSLTSNHNSPKVLRFDTAQESLDGIVNSLLGEFDLKDGKGEVAHLWIHGAG